MEMKKLHDDLGTLKRQVGEVILLLGGSASMDYKGMRAEFKELKTDVSNIKLDIEKMKRAEQDRWSIQIKTIPQKVVAFLAFSVMILTAIQTIKEIFIK